MGVMHAHMTIYGYNACVGVCVYGKVTVWTKISCATIWCTALLPPPARCGVCVPPCAVGVEVLGQDRDHGPYGMQAGGAQLACVQWELKSL